MKKKIIKFIIGALLILLAIFIYRELFIYKTMDEALSDQINSETKIEAINITVYLENGLERRTKTRIEDDEILSTIQNGFTNMELKKIRSTDIDILDMDYSIEVIATNLVAEKHYSTQSVNIAFNQHDLIIIDGDIKSFEIVSESNHMEVMDNLLNNLELEWVEFE